jgi:hypothetical protein
MLYKGSCHCGNVAFEVEGELTGAVECNCSICSRKGALLWAVPHEKLIWRGSDTDLGTYTFNNHAIAPPLLPELRYSSLCGRRRRERRSQRLYQHPLH